MGKIDKISLKEILEQIDLIIRENDIVYFCENADVINKFMTEYKGKINSQRKVKDFLIENEKYIDKDKLVLLMVLNYKDNINMIKDKIKLLSSDLIKEMTDSEFTELSKYNLQLKLQKDMLQKAQKIGKGMESFLTIYYYDEIQKRYRVEVIDSREVIDERKDLKSKTNLKRLDEIDLLFKEGNKEEKVGIEYVLQSVLLTDLYKIFPDEQFGDCVRTMILENNIINNGIATRKEIEDLKLDENLQEYLNLLDVKDQEYLELLPDFKEALREYSQYIDIDKLLLISAYRFNEALESGYIHEQGKIASVRELLKGILLCIKKQNTSISCQLQKRKDDGYIDINVNYSVNKIKECMSKFTSNSYLTDNQIKEYRQKIQEKEMNLLEIDSDCIDIIFSGSELEDISTLSEENLIYVSDKNKWETNRMVDAIINIGKCNNNLLNKLLEEEKITSNQLIELYEQNIISLEQIKSVKEKIDLSNEVSFKTLNTYYEESKKDMKDEEKISAYKRYSELYKEVLIEDKKEEQIEENAYGTMEYIAENYEKEEYIKVIENYYKEGILTLNSIMEWSNQEIIIRLYNDGIIEKEDIEKLVQEQKISLDYLYNTYEVIIKDEDISYDERLNYIKTGYIKKRHIFDLFKKNLIFEEDLKELSKIGIINEEELQRIIDSRTKDELEKNSSIRLIGLNNLSKLNKPFYSPGGRLLSLNEETDKTKLIIDLNKRNEFINLLKAQNVLTDAKKDSPFYDYEFYVIPDETGEIGLNSVIIAERYYDNKDTENRPATDNATYFFRYKDLMVLSNLKKSEMTQERENIVFTARHVIASKQREGYWAKNVVFNIAKTMLSSGLKEYTKKQQKDIILKKLEEVYTKKELVEIFDVVKDIDKGEYICEVEGPTKREFKVNNNPNEDGR